jgi:hypothetical protein
MQSPLWQFWTDWTIKALAAMATLLVVLVALLGARFRHWIAPPRLRIALTSPEGWRGNLYTFDPETRIASQTPGIWYHVDVINGARWNPVTGVHIFLRSVEVPDASGMLKPIWEGNVALGWRHEPSPQPKTIGYSAQCDLCHVIKDPRQARLSPLIKGQAPDAFTGPFKIAATLQSRGIEADSGSLRIEISWNGEWSDNGDEMKRHLVVREVSVPD